MSMIRCLFILAMLCLFQKAFGQFTLDIIQPNEFALKTADLWNCIISNNSNLSQNAFIHGILTEKRKGKLFEIESGKFILPTGVTQFNTSNYEALKNEKVLYSDKQFEDHVYRTNTFPNGNYTLCITLNDAQNLTALASRCIDFTIQKTTSVNLISPIDKDSLCEQNINFIWMPNSINSSDNAYRYGLRIFEILKYQTAIAAATKNPPFYEDKNININQYQIPYLTIPFKANVAYAWQIEIFDENNKVQSKSEVWTLIIKDCMGAIAESEQDNTDKPKPVNKKRKNFKYYSLYDEVNIDPVNVLGDTLNVMYASYLKEEKVYCRLVNSEGKSIYASEKIISQEDPYIRIPFSELKTIINNLYILEIINRLGKKKYLKFKTYKKNI